MVLRFPFRNDRLISLAARSASGRQPLPVNPRIGIALAKESVLAQICVYFPEKPTFNEVIKV